MARLALVLVAGVLLLAPAVPLAQEKTDAPVPAGTWAFTLPFTQNGTQPLHLIRLEQKDSKWSGKILATAMGWPKGNIQDVTVTDDTLRFVIKGDAMVLSC